MPLTSLLSLETQARADTEAGHLHAAPLDQDEAVPTKARTRRRNTIRPSAEVRRPACPPVLTAVLVLARTPNARHRLRREKVPSGTRQLFRIAAGRTSVINDAVRFTGKDPHFLQAATIFYIEQVLWFADADPHRILGLNPNAPFDVVSAHVEVILDWLSAPKDNRDRAGDLERVRLAWQSIDHELSLPR
jgi:hypothetical protein